MNDVVIIGGGIFGLSIAFELQSRGLGTRIVDPKGPATEASWAAAGMLAPQLESTKNDASWCLGRASRGLYSSWLQRLSAFTDRDPHYVNCGALRCYASLTERDEDWAAYRWQVDSGERLEKVEFDWIRMGSCGLGLIGFGWNRWQRIRLDSNELGRIECDCIGLH